MIRRGLQVIAVVCVLGAAPCSYGQAGTTNMPTFVVLQDFENSAINGQYTLVGTSEVSGSYTFQRYSTAGAPSFWMTLWDHNTAGTVIASIHTEYPTGLTTALAYSRSVSSGGSWPESYSGNWNGLNGFTDTTGTVLFNWSTPPVDPYEEAFPDWESAVITIPLGFAFAMAFWASATAITIGMRWAKELASVAT